MNRPSLTTTAILWLLTLPAWAQPMDFETLDQKATELAASRYRTPVQDPSSPVHFLDYDGYRALAFRNDRTLWQDEASLFRAQFFHLGYLFKDPVQLNLQKAKQVSPVECSADWFDYSGSHLNWDGFQSDGFAGFKLMSPLVNGDGNWSEVGAFLGASYFRLLGEGQSYGISARGLAIDTAHPTNPEEFPRFVEHWLEQPEACDESIRIYSLLDSPSVTGAYAFTIKPGKTTIADVEVSLHFRNDVDRLGLAPLTSMYWVGKSGERLYRDYRPEVHDSDGLLMKLETGETLWRPLVNDEELRTSVFTANNVRGFGLMQRERRFEQYQDLWNPYHNTPSLFIEPVGDWGDGHIWLFEFPTEREVDDNIVLFWEPAQAPKAGETRRFQYRMSWMKKEERKVSPNHVIATRMGHAQDFGNNTSIAENERIFIVDFKGPKLALPKEPKLGEEPVEPQPAPVPIVSASLPDRISAAFCTPNPHTNSWRAVFRVDVGHPRLRRSIELRCFLKRDDEVVSETWSYLWSP